METQKNPGFFLAAYDVSGIQDYIFATNRMKENIGASFIVSDILKEALPQALLTLEKEYPGKQVETDWEQLTSFQMEEQDQIIAEVIYIGGGNAFVVFRSEEYYRAASQKLAEIIVDISTSLTVASSVIRTEGRSFTTDRKKLLCNLETVKNRLVRRQLLSPYPIVEQDPIFGFPVTEERDGEKLSSVQAEKRKVFQEKKDRKDSIFGITLPKETGYAVEMRDMAAIPGEDSYVAVVHMDGNGMGELLNKKLERIGADYKEAIPAIRTLSLDISNIYIDVFRKLMEGLWKYLGKGDKENQLPVRLLVMDGDDVTFICNGRLGIPLAAAFIRMLMKTGEQNLSACAGIALVHSHFPFRLAYETAEECCGNAKKKWYEKGDKKTGFLDFQLLRGASQRELSELRVNHILNRPYKILPDCDTSVKESFDHFEEIISRLPDPSRGEDVNTWPRSRLKKLFLAYLGNQAGLEALKKEFASRGYDTAALAGGEKISLFDALEVMDMYDREVFSAVLDLQEGEKNAEILVDKH